MNTVGGASCDFSIQISSCAKLPSFAALVDVSVFALPLLLMAMPDAVRSSSPIGLVGGKEPANMLHVATPPKSCRLFHISCNVVFTQAQSNAMHGGAVAVACSRGGRTGMPTGQTAVPLLRDDIGILEILRRLANYFRACGVPSSPPFCIFPIQLAQKSH